MQGSSVLIDLEIDHIPDQSVKKSRKMPITLDKAYKGKGAIKSMGYPMHFEEQRSLTLGGERERALEKKKKVRCR